MQIKTINKLIGYGILVFTIGFFFGLLWFQHLQLLMPIGSLSTFVGIVYFFKDTNLHEQFRRPHNEDVLTYFWNVIVLKFWTLVFVLWMISMDLTLMFQGLI